MFAVDDRGVIFAVKFGTIGAFGFEVVQVFQEQDPRGLLDIVQLVGDAFFGAKVSLDLVKCVLVQWMPALSARVLAAYHTHGMRGELPNNNSRLS